jgi:Skp family chaperone for outer membrane proteins
MRRLTFPIILILVLAAVPATAGKIGFVDAERAVAEVDEGKARLAELQAWQAPHQARLDQLRDQVLALRDQLAAQQGKASAEAVAEIEKNQIKAVREFEDVRRVYERDLEAKKNEVLADIAKKIGNIGSEYAKANEYDVVFILGAQPVIYLAESADLTDEVIEIYNKRFPVAGR